MSLQLPRNEEAEFAAVGCCIRSPELAAEFKPEWFFDARLGEICRIIQKLSTGREHVDFAMIYEACKPSVEKVMELLNKSDDHSPTPIAYRHWLEKLVDAYNRRKAITAANSFLMRAPTADGEFPLLIDELEQALEMDTANAFEASNGKECTAKLMASLEHRFEHRDTRSGLATGIRRLDDLTDGLQFGEQTLIAARPSIGKTAIAMNIAAQVCLTDKVPTLVVSLEMSTQALMRRLLSCAQRVSMRVLKYGTFNEGEFESFQAFNKLVTHSPLYVVDAVSGMTANEYSAVVKKHVRRYGVRLVITDYLQKIKCGGKHEKRTYEVGEVSGVVRGLAVRTKAAFLTLAQLNRESEKEKGRMPRLADLADSGQIERDADTVALLHRPRDENRGHDATLIVAKQRDGEVGTIKLNFRGEYCLFENPII